MASWITFQCYNCAVAAVFAVTYSKTTANGQLSLLKSYRNWLQESHRPLFHGPANQPLLLLVIVAIVHCCCCCWSLLLLVIVAIVVIVVMRKLLLLLVIVAIVGC